MTEATQDDGASMLDALLCPTCKGVGLVEPPSESGDAVGPKGLPSAFAQDEQNPSPLPEGQDLAELKRLQSDEIEALQKKWPRVVAAMLAAERAQEAAEAEVSRLLSELETARGERDEVQGYLDRANAAFHELDGKRTLEALRATHRAQKAEADLSRALEALRKIAKIKGSNGARFIAENAILATLSKGGGNG